MEFGLFAEQTRSGASQGDAFREMFDLADAAEAWGLDVFWVAEMLLNPARSVLVSASPGGKLDRGAHQALARGDGGAAPSPEPPASRRR